MRAKAALVELLVPMLEMGDVQRRTRERSAIGRRVPIHHGRTGRAGAAGWRCGETHTLWTTAEKAGGVAQDRYRVLVCPRNCPS